MEALKKELEKFKSIRLEEMDRVRLMDRKECKFTVNGLILSHLFSEIEKDYYVLEIQDQRLMPYTSVYFDTQDFSFYTSHQNGKLNRYKVRQRTYELTGLRFLELKFKNNKKRTIKKRIEINQLDVNRYEGFLKKYLPPAYQLLEEKIVVRYQRITLVERSFKERVTIDLNLQFSTFTKESRFDDMAVIEIKNEGDLKESAIYQMLNKWRIKPQSFSKYCLGISENYPQVKRNFMNVKMRNIRKSLSSLPREQKYQRAAGI